MAGGTLTTASPSSGKIKVHEGSSFISLRDVGGATVTISEFVGGAEYPLLDQGNPISITADDNSEWLIGGGMIEIAATGITTPINYAVRNAVEN